MFSDGFMEVQGWPSSKGRYLCKQVKEMCQFFHFCAEEGQSDLSQIPDRLEKSIYCLY